MKERNIERFNADVESSGGYLYTDLRRLSSVMSNARMTRAILEMAPEQQGLKIIDIGCGDGTFTIELMELSPAEILGVDAAPQAIEAAQEKAAGFDTIRFCEADIYELEALNAHFDLAVVRGVLHHLYEAEKAVAGICKIADEVLIVEPNGYNPVLKIIEKLSPYHVAHEEKSYTPSSLDAWFKKHGKRRVARRFIGLVPMFCPAWLAKTLKWIEPLTEALPYVRTISCGQYVMRATSITNDQKSLSQ
jgi:ubiquinone/menaquinone biosynthesis C-methylase UbiE